MCLPLVVPLPVEVSLILKAAREGFQEPLPAAQRRRAQRGRAFEIRTKVDGRPLQNAGLACHVASVRDVSTFRTLRAASAGRLSMASYSIQQPASTMRSLVLTFVLASVAAAQNPQRHFTDGVDSRF